MMLFSVHMCECVWLCVVSSVALSTRMRLTQHTSIHVPMKWYVVYMMMFDTKPHDTYPYFDVCCYISASRCSLNSLLLVFSFSLAFYNNSNNTKQWQRQWKFFPKTQIPLYVPPFHFYVFYARFDVYLLNALTIFALCTVQ